MSRLIWLDTIPNVQFSGAPVSCEIIGTSRFQDQITLYVRIPVHDAHGYGFVVYLATVDSAYRDIRWART